MILLRRRHRYWHCALVGLLTFIFPQQELLARGGGGFRGGGGGGGGFHGGGGGGGGGFHGGGAGAGGGGARPGGGGGAGGAGGNRSPSFSHAGGGGAAGGGAGRAGGAGAGARTNPGAGNRAGAGAGERANTGIGNRTNIGGNTRTNFGEGGNRAGAGNRTGINNQGNRANVANRTNADNRTNVNRGNINNISGNTVNVNRGGYYHGYNNYWHHGYWHNNWYGGGWWAGAGLAAWGLGSLAYSSGYASYANPYYGGGGSAPAYADYSQPIMTSADQQQPADPYANVPSEDPQADEPSPEVKAALAVLDEAREAFKAGNYDLAQKKIDQALEKLPKDAALHEFRALVLFARGQFKDSAAGIYAVLSVGPGWDWTTLISMYPSVDVYTAQLRVLEDFRKANPNAAEAAFLLAYHYMTCGHTDAAAKQLRAVTELLPDDTLAPQLLSLLTGGKKSTAGQAAPPEADDQPPQIQPAPGSGEDLDSLPPVDKAKLQGAWKASRGKAANINLSLNSDGSFVWKVAQGEKTNSIEGKYSVEGSLLLLNGSDGSNMVGRVLQKDKGGFNFKLLETGPTDPGLDFAK